MWLPPAVALVTGSAQGIGRSIALRLADEGFDVAVNDISANQTKLEALVDEIRAKGRASSQHVADVSQEEQVKVLFKQAAEHHAGLDVVTADAATVPVEEWDRVMNINARGTFLCYKAAGGRIIGASSPTGTLPGPYCASKFAVRGLTQAAALELGAHGITVNAYAPGCIDTPLPSLSVTGGFRGRTLVYSPSSHSVDLRSVPEDVSNLVSFLASKESQFITAHLHLQISVNGGTYFD
ncbi:NAD-binding protein [Mycena olivaceomarginata]|nr:NAD-binding protein [Mycena olivaceomarginata]